MKHLYYRGDQILLYVVFQNATEENQVLDPQVRVRHERKGNVVEDIAWTPLTKLSTKEYLYAWTVPFDADYGLYEVNYKGTIDGNVARVGEHFSVFFKNDSNQSATRVFGFVHQARTGYVLGDVNVRVESIDGIEAYSESWTDYTGRWEAFLYPGEYKFIFSKHKFEQQEYVVKIGDELQETQFNNVILDTEEASKRGTGSYVISDTYVLKDGTPLNNLSIVVYNPLQDNKIIAETSTDNKGEWYVYLDAGLYLLKVSGDSQSQNFDKTFRLRVDQLGQFSFEDISLNVAMIDPGETIGRGNGIRTITDKVEDKYGNPIVDVMVQVFEQGTDKLIAQDYTDPTGKWELYLNPGQYKFEFYHPEFKVITEDRTIG